MDTTGATPDDDSHGLTIADPPSIGVPDVPAPADQVLPPAPVPSVSVPTDVAVPAPADVTAPVSPKEASPAATPPASQRYEARRSAPVPADTIVVNPAPPAPPRIGLERRPLPGPGARSSRPTGPTETRPSPAPAPPTPAAAAPAGVAPPDPEEPDGPTFAPGVVDKLQSYVYLLVDPRTGRAFYVGRGRGDRCFRHVQAARSGPQSAPSGSSDAPVDDDKEYPVLDRIRDVESSGREVRIDILRYGLSPAEAQLVEAAVNDSLGLGADPKLGSQRQSAIELNARLTKRAKFKRAHQVVLLRVGGRGSDTSYEAVRHGWRIGRRWTDIESRRSPEWAVIVVGELVAAVYRIERWEATPLRSRTERRHVAASTARSTYRFSFAGTIDAELERRYVGKSVAGHLGAGTPSPITYVWCGPHWVNTAI